MNTKEEILTTIAAAGVGAMAGPGAVVGLAAWGVARTACRVQQDSDVRQTIKSVRLKVGHIIGGENA